MTYMTIEQWVSARKRLCLDTATYYKILHSEHKLMDSMIEKRTRAFAHARILAEERRGN